MIEMWMRDDVVDGECVVSIVDSETENRVTFRITRHDIIEDDYTNVLRRRSEKAKQVYAFIAHESD